MKTKKHKKHKSERYEDERSDKEPLRLVLKVGESVSAHSPHHESKKHKHKKKKKKKSKDKDKDHHRREEQERPAKRHHPEDTEDEMEVSQEEDNDVKLSNKPTLATDNIDTDDTEHEDVDVPTPQRPRAQPMIHTPSKGDDEHGVLRIGLKYLHNKMQSKDVNGFFAYPVNDMIAPGYSLIIAQPMDFSTMMTKIDNNEYNNVLEFKRDFVLMCNNAMHYNRPETIYYKEAKKLLHTGMKAMSKDKLLLMKRTQPFLASLRYEELGINEPDETKVIMEAIVEEEKEHKQRAKDREEIGRFEAVPDNMSAAEILSQAKAAAKDAADMLALRQPRCRFGFLRKKDDGSTSMTLLNPDNDGIVSKRERIISIGKLVGKLGSGGGTLTGYKEDKRNRVTPGQYLNYGPFGTYAPQYDSTFANMTKEETNILLSTYGDETGVSYAKSVLDFVENGGDYAVSMVDNLLDILTKGEHAKTKMLLEQRMKDDGVMTVHGTDIGKKTSAKDDNANIDLDSLRSLSDIGVDMSFLDSMEKPVKKEKDPVQEKLDQTATLIKDLQQTQNERLSQSIPPHISQVPAPSEKEIQLAQKVTKELKELAQEANPGNAASVQGLRKAIGISYQSFDSAQSTFMSSQPSLQTPTHTQSIEQSLTVPNNQPVPTLQTSIPQNQPVIGTLQPTTIRVAEPTMQTGTVFSSNIPNIISQQSNVPSYQPPVATPTALINQQTQILQPATMSFPTGGTTLPTTIPFQQAAMNTINTINQQYTGSDVGNSIQNGADQNVTTINDDDSDIDMDISEFLQFPSS